MASRRAAFGATTGIESTAAESAAGGEVRRRRLTTSTVETALVLALALALRLFGLERKSVWFDEAISAWFASLPPPELLEATTREANPPLYYLLLHWWLPLGQGDAWLRLPSALFGAGAAMCAVLLGRALFGRRAGLLAGLFTALAPFQIDASQEARAYALLTFLATASLLLLARALAHGGWRWAAWGSVTALCLYAQYYAFFLVVAEALYLAATMAWQRRFRWQPWAALSLVGLLFVPWLPAFVTQLSTLSGSYWIPPPYQGILWDTYAAFISHTPPDGPAAATLLKLGRWLILGLVGLALVSVVLDPRGVLRWVSRRRNGAEERELAGGRPQVLLPALAVATPIAGALLLSAWLAPLYLIRYLAFVVPAFWVVVAHGLDLLPMPYLRWLFAGLVAASVAVNLPALYFDPTYGRADLRAAAQLISDAAEPGDVVVHTRAFSEAPFAYYLGARLDEVLLPEDDADALGQAVAGRVRFWYVRDFGLLDPSEAAAAEAEARRYLAGWPIAEHYRLLGVHLFLVQQGPALLAVTARHTWYNSRTAAPGRIGNEEVRP